MLKTCLKRHFTKENLLRWLTSSEQILQRCLGCFFIQCRQLQVRKALLEDLNNLELFPSIWSADTCQPLRHPAKLSSLPQAWHIPPNTSTIGPLCQVQASPWLRCSLKSLLQFSHSLVAVVGFPINGDTGALRTILHKAFSLSVSSGERFPLRRFGVAALEMSFLAIAPHIFARSNPRSSSSILKLSSCNFQRCSLTRAFISRRFWTIICKLLLSRHFWTIWCIRRLMYFVLNPHPSHWTILKSHSLRCNPRSLRQTFLAQPMLVQSVKVNRHWWM